jgi:hypothetical protein
VGGFKDPQNIVLGKGQAVLLENGGMGAFEIFRGPDNRHEHFFVQGQVISVIGLGHGVQAPFFPERVI